MQCERRRREQCLSWLSDVRLLSPCVLMAVLASLSVASAQLNERPIVGVLAEEIAWSLRDRYEDLEPYSHIAASYVKFVEGGGARPIPIWIGKSEEYYRDIMSQINGVLFPGGGLWFNETKGYAEAGRYIYDIARELNDQGNYFPIWGTCLGFELLGYLSAGNEEIRCDCKSQKIPLPLQFKDDFRDSKMFRECPEEVVEVLRSKPVTANFHSYCITEANLTSFNLNREWRVISLNDDQSEKPIRFISSMEHMKYPFYGVQFHPEKVLYEWVENYNIPHLAEAAKASQYFARFFIEECRKSAHKFPDYNEENRHSIYNFPITFTALKGSTYQQAYMFQKDVDYPTSESVRLDCSQNTNRVDC